MLLFRYIKICLVILIVSAGSLNIVSGQPININDQLILRLPFTNNSNDESGHGNHATVFGASLGVDRHGHPTGAYYFNGIDDYIELSDDFDYPERSICFWFRATEIPTWIPGNKDASLDILYTSDHPDLLNGLSKFWISKMDGMDMVFFHNGGPTNIDDYAYRILPGEWNFVAMTVTPFMIHYYLNGALVGSRQYPGNIHSVDITELETAALGIGRTLDHRFYKGAIDDVYIYNKAIHACEVQYLYEGFLPEER